MPPKTGKKEEKKSSITPTPKVEQKGIPKPARTKPPLIPRKPEARSIVLIDPIKGTEERIKPKAVIAEEARQERLAKAAAAGQDITRKPLIAQRKREPTKDEIDQCIEAEKNKPWIRGYQGTLIKLEEGNPSDELFTTLVEKQSPKWDGWSIPSDNYYKIMCKDFGNYITRQMGPKLTIERLGELSSAVKRDNSKIVVLVGNIISQGDGKDKKDILIQETNEYKTARKKYFERLMITCDQELSNLLYKKLSSSTSEWNTIREIVDNYVSKFKDKLGTKVNIQHLTNMIIQNARDEGSSVGKLLGNIVKSTLFLRNEFSGVNSKLISKLKKGILDIKQLTTMTNAELLPEVFLNPDLDTQMLRSDLDTKITALIKSTIENLGTNICISMKNDIYKGWSPQSKEITPEKLPLIEESIGNLWAFDFIPLENLCVAKAAKAEGNHLSSTDIEKLKEIVFYKDQDGQIFCYNLSEIKSILESGNKTNPLTGKDFTPEFLANIKKLNLSHIPSEYDYIVNTQFGDESDDEARQGVKKGDISDVASHDDDPAGALMVAQTDPGSLKKSSDSIKLVAGDFWDRVENVLLELERRNVQHFSFGDDDEIVKEKYKPQYCFACSKRLTKENEWSHTINIDKKNGNYINNTYHISCLYNAPFKI